MGLSLDALRQAYVRSGERFVIELNRIIHEWRERLKWRGEHIGETYCLRLPNGEYVTLNALLKQLGEGEALAALRELHFRIAKQPLPLRLPRLNLYHESASFVIQGHAANGPFASDSRAREKFSIFFDFLSRRQEDIRTLAPYTPQSL